MYGDEREDGCSVRTYSRSDGHGHGSFDERQESGDEGNDDDLVTYIVYRCSEWVSELLGVHIDANPIIHTYIHAYISTMIVLTDSHYPSCC